MKKLYWIILSFFNFLGIFSFWGTETPCAFNRYEAPSMWCTDFNYAAGITGVIGIVSLLLLLFYNPDRHSKKIYQYTGLVFIATILTQAAIFLRVFWF